MNAMPHSTRLLLAGFAPAPLCLIRCVRGATALVLALAVAACGGGGGGGGAPASTAVVASVAIRDTGLMLQQSGDSRQLSAVAKDAQGNELDVPIAWTSSKPAALGVDATGKVTAASASGSSQIVATAQGVKSAPLLAVVVQPAAGTVLLSDAQILGDPVETDPNAAPSFANTYRVTLTGVATPTVGALLVGTGSKAVAGRVVAVDTSTAGQTTVTLALVRLPELFPNLQIDEVFDLSQSAVTYSDAVLAVYNVERVGNTFTFTPKPASAQGSSREQAQANAIGTRRALGPFSCDDSAITGLAGGPLPVQLTAPPLISITISPSLDLRYTPTAGLERLVVKAEPTLGIASELTASIAFEGKLSCKLELFVFPIPIGGALSFAVGGLVPVGAGFELGGKITLASMKLTSNVEAKAKAEIGIVCPGGTACALHTLLEPALKFDPKLTLPSAGLSGLRLEPTLEIFGTVDADIGSRLLRSLRWEVLETKFGGKLEGSFATRDAQIADAGYKSDYKLSLEAKAGVGFGLHEALGALGLESLTVVERTISTDIATSPTATVSADRATFSVGDTVNLKAVLDPVTFLSLYNVDRIVWVRDAGGTRTTVGTQTASSGQTEFNFAFVAPTPGSTSELFAFVITALPFDSLALELGNAPAGGLALEQRQIDMRIGGKAFLRQSIGSVTLLEEIRQYEGKESFVQTLQAPMPVPMNYSFGGSFVATAASVVDSIGLDPHSGLVSGGTFTGRTQTSCTGMNHREAGVSIHQAGPNSSYTYDLKFNATSKGATVTVAGVIRFLGAATGNSQLRAVVQIDREVLELASLHMNATELPFSRTITVRPNRSFGLRANLDARCDYVFNDVLLDTDRAAEVSISYTISPN